MTPSERRLHPVSILFALGQSLRAFAVPLLLLFVGSQSTGRGPFRGVPGSGNWDSWALWLLVPIMAAAVVRYLTFRMRYEGTELVIRSGLFFKNERHIPYGRIQNLNAIRNVFHRMLGMTDVQIETGSGQKAEATISVVPLAVLDEMRSRVFAARGEAAAATEVTGAAAAAPTLPDQTVLRLPFRELALLSVVQNRGLLPIAAGLGLLWEVGLLDRLAEAAGIGDAPSGGALRRVLQTIASPAADGAAGALSLGAWQIVGALATIALLLVVVQVLSLLWVVARLHGFTLTRLGEDLRTDYGLLTRVTATVPLRRVQTLTVEQGPLQRLVGRVSVRVETAGGGGVPSGGMSAQFGEGSSGGHGNRHWLAPIVRQAAVPDLVRAVLPDLDVSALTWHPPHPRAFRRAARRAVFATSLLSLAVAFPALATAGWWALALVPPLLGWSVVVARQHVRRMAWADTPEIVAFRSGWIWRRVTVARTAKIQVVTRLESPFDRRTAMGRVRVDTAGGGPTSDRVDIPYLAIEVADDLYRRLVVQAGSTEFRW